jgi:hypothetical protein
MLSTTGKSLGIACAVAAALAVSIAPAASAKGGNGTRVAGVCSAASTSFLKAKADDGRIEVEFEVDQNRAGVPWDVTLTRNGTTVFAGTRTTVAPSGSFSVERKIAGGAAPVIRARAVRNGETCTASLRLPAAKAAAAAAAPVATTTAAPAVKLRGDGTVDDTSASAPAAEDHHGDNSGPGSVGEDNSGSGRNGGADDHGHGGSDD